MGVGEVDEGEGGEVVGVVSGEGGGGEGEEKIS